MLSAAVKSPTQLPTPRASRHYLWIQTDLSFGASHAMDNVRSENIAALRACADRLADRARPQLQKLLPMLSG